MLAARRTRQQQANSINLTPAAWDQLPWPGMGMATLQWFSIPATERQKNRRDALK